MRILLVNMPWAPIETPSLALGLLKRCVDEQVPDAEAEVIHANIDYVDWLTEHGGFTNEDYEYYATTTFFSGFGDWVFSSAVYDDPTWRSEEFTKWMRDGISERHLAMSHRLHELALEFVADLAERIVATAPDVVGFTTTFQQNTATLAAAKYVKRLAPQTLTIVGGANCDGPQGASMHRNFRFLDLVARGEGETTLAQCIAVLRDEGSFADVPGLCWRDAEGGSVANPMSARPLSPAQIVSPNYDGYFERLAVSAARTWVEPKLVVEGSRGCWWGEKHHCTFCGLNGSYMEYRSKSPDRFFTEVMDLVERHQVPDIYVVDNILDMNYIKSMLPRIAESGYDLRFYYEIKSNLRRDQLRMLADAGLVALQPGIESLSSRVLKLMDKGVTGCQNVRLMRDAETTGLTLSWNYLYGFPGETDEDYDSIIDQLPALHHLIPGSMAARIEVERFSPFFNRPELGFGDLRPAEHYELIYDLPEAEAYDFAYVFAAAPHGIGETTADRLRAAMTEWQGVYASSRLSQCDLGDQILLVNTRRHFDWHWLSITDPAEVAAFRLLDQPHSLAALARKLETPAETVTALLDRWGSLGLIFTDGGQFIQIAPVAANQELLRIDQTGSVNDADRLRTDLRQALA